MAAKHVVKPGECLASIARRYGFVNPRIIWDSPDNEALRKKRRNPDVLAPGDEVAIPDKRKREVSVGSGESANLTLDRAMTRLHLKVCDGHGMTCKAERYVLRVDGVADPFEDKLTDSGEVDAEIPATARRAELDVFVNGVEAPVQQFELHLGHMDPVETLAGVRARLETLGYRCGGEEGELGPLTRAAILAFQRTHALDSTGDPSDEKLQQALLDWSTPEQSAGARAWPKPDLTLEAGPPGRRSKASLQKIIEDAAWGADSAETESDVPLFVRTRGFPDGTAVKIEIRPADGASGSAPLAPLAGKIQVNQYAAHWSYAPVGGNFLEGDFIFECHVGGESATSGVLHLTLKDLTEAALIASGQALQAAGKEAAFLRALYKQGWEEVARRRAKLQAKVAAGLIPEKKAAEALARMRFNLAMRVRRTGSTLMRVGAELVDRARSQGRPTYRLLREAGKKDGRIIETAAKSNKFINRLPRALKWTGRGLWVLQGVLSVLIVLDAPPDQREVVARQQANIILGGVLGGAAAEGALLLFGISTGGIGLLVILAGSIVGSMVAENIDLLELLDVAPHFESDREGTFYYLEGAWGEADLLITSVGGRAVKRSDGVLVLATGRVGGQLTSGRGHYRPLEVVPVSRAAVSLLGTEHAEFVPDYMLGPVEPRDFEAAAAQDAGDVGSDDLPVPE